MDQLCVQVAKRDLFQGSRQPDSHRTNIAARRDGWLSIKLAILVKVGAYMSLAQTLML